MDQHIHKTLMQITPFSDREKECERAYSNWAQTGDVQQSRSEKVSLSLVLRISNHRYILISLYCLITLCCTCVSLASRVPVFSEGILRIFVGF